MLSGICEECGSIVGVNEEFCSECGSDRVVSYTDDWPGFTGYVYALVCDLCNKPIGSFLPVRWGNAVCLECSNRLDEENGFGA
jgi:RNA polymerase subunit RPABC4/transcription elongation factor Spt4